MVGAALMALDLLYKRPPRPTTRQSLPTRRTGPPCRNRCGHSDRGSCASRATGVARW
jgi:hypothetical protein